MIYYLLLILCGIIMILFGQIDDIFGIHIIPNIGWSYEFTKTVFFIIALNIIFLCFIWKRNPIFIPKYVPLLYIIIILTTFFSLSPLTSLIGWVSKWHGMLFFLSLLHLHIIIYNLPKIRQKWLLQCFLYISPLICLFAVWQFFLPSFDYGNLENRALGSFGHPNYLAGYILLLLPIISIIPHKIYRVIIWVMLVVTLLLTKSAWALLIALCYGIYISKKYISWTMIYIWVLLVSAIIVWVLYEFSFWVKLHSFLARFFIWETTLSIIFSDIKIFLFGAGFETLPLLFDSYKSEYLYIFENIWFRADRPHNIFLNIWYSSGVLWLWVLGYIYYQIKKYSHLKPNIYWNALILFGVFLVFNYASVVHMIIVSLIFCLALWKNIPVYHSKLSTVVKISISIIILMIIYLIWSVYTAEIHAKNYEYQKASQSFPLPGYLYKIWAYETGKKYEWFESETYYISQIVHHRETLSPCENLVGKYPTVENYFYCGELLEWVWETESAIDFYIRWLDILPNLWEDDSEYYNNIFIQYFFDGRRFYSERYSRLSNILYKVKTER